ncbi:DUF397 domain-containing protein [Streptomyces sp. NA04227]|uniref:DUF397 domain-containing protein n=1 Tax=Streptomyces sp. NA04227 TaxID=2742136 RepID=UPI0015919EB0|nr:DUF397 domain-containing protein [Streptomyces sp. NA04227]QKW07869.1 DUF397 domain-containing protein [Streptomyces sp. NA04227]
MGTGTWIPPNTTWRKSSYSGDSGGDCIECTPLGDVTWRKSSYSGNTGGECIEIAAQPCQIAIRDSKNPHGPVFTIGAAAFTAFTVAARQGAFEEPGAH